MSITKRRLTLNIVKSFDFDLVFIKHFCKSSDMMFIDMTDSKVATLLIDLNNEIMNDSCDTKIELILNKLKKING